MTRMCERCWGFDDTHPCICDGDGDPAPHRAERRRRAPRATVEPAPVSTLQAMLRFVLCLG